MDQVIRKKSKSWPYFAEDEIEAVVEVLRSGHVNQWGGAAVHRFQELFAQRIGVSQTVAVANGSMALELALRAFDIGPGDEVIVTSRSFIASASCVSIVGAQPVFADVNRDSGNIDVDTIAPLINKRTRAIIPVHLGGWPCDMPGIMKLAKAHNIYVIEDCAQALGAMIDGKPVGSFGDASAFSFCQDKIITTGGEGGALCLNDSDRWLKAWSFKDHGKDWHLAFQAEKTPWFKWVHSTIGTNMRMTEMQAAIGIKQLEKLDGWLQRRSDIYKIWQECLKNCTILRMPTAPNNYKNAHYRIYAYLDPTKTPDDIAGTDLLLALSGEGITAFSGTCPEIYREKAFSDLAPIKRVTAHELAKTGIAFPINPMQETKEISELVKRTVSVLNEMFVKT